MRLNKMKYGILILLSLALLGCEKKQSTEKIIRPVMVLDLSNQKKTYDIEFPGLIVANNDTILGFKVPGSISKINVLAGDKVKKGDIIATLDISDYTINLEANSQKYDAAKAEYTNKVQQYKRAVVLHDGKAMSDKNFDIITAQYKAAAAQYKAAEQAVKNANNKLDDTKLKAPFDGYIGKRILDEGTVVGPGTPVVSIVSEGKLRVDINVAAKDLDIIKNANSYTFAREGKQYKLKLITIGKNTDLLKLTYPVTFEFAEGNVDDLIIGSSGNVKVNVTNNEYGDITVPLTALFDKNGSCVYLYKDGTAVPQKVELGNLKSEGQITIVKGLNRDDKVIIAGVHTISEGEKVKILQKPSPTNVGGVL